MKAGVSDIMASRHLDMVSRLLDMANALFDRKK
jgi:hypothetical protein